MIPTSIRDDVKTYLWAEADRLFWASLSAIDKARYYTIWTENPSVGGKLATYMDPRQVRVYIKDTLLKSYTRERLASASVPIKLLGLAEDTAFIEQYIKPHGRRLLDGRQIAWSRASEWKATLMALHERAFQTKSAPFGAVLFEAGSKHGDQPSRLVVEDASSKLGIKKLIWID